MCIGNDTFISLQLLNHLGDRSWDHELVLCHLLCDLEVGENMKKLQVKTDLPKIPIPEGWEAVFSGKVHKGDRIALIPAYKFVLVSRAEINTNASQYYRCIRKIKTK